MNAALVYNGKEIRSDGDYLNLTDMWRAAGADPSRRPAKWLETEQAKQFVEFVENSKGVRSEDILRNEPGNPRKGDGGATLAYWQIGMAYAKYLSPAFHAWCNQVVRAYMEGKLAPIDPFAGLTEKIADGIQRGIAPMVETVARLTERQSAVEQKVDCLTEQVVGVVKYVDRLANKKRRPFSKLVRCSLTAITAASGNRCQGCDRVFELTEFEIHHCDGNPGNNAPSNAAHLCKGCHDNVGITPERVEMARRFYWERIKHLFPTKPHVVQQGALFE